MIRPLALSLIVALLAGCSPHAPATSDAGANASAAPASAATNALAGTPMAEYGHALDRAKNVQHVVNDRAKKQAKAIDAATGGQ